MTIRFDDLPRWQFSIDETSPGLYAMEAVRDDGIRGQASGPERMFDDLKDWARKIDQGQRAGST